MFSMEKIVIDCARNFFRLNTVTEELYVIKYQGQLASNPEQPVNCRDFLEAFIRENTIHPSDLPQFEIMRDPNALICQFKQDDSSSSFIYRRIEGSKLVWSRLDVLIPSSHCEESPEILIYGHNLNAEESAYFASYVQRGKNILKIGKVSFSDQSFYAIQQPYPEQKFHERHPIRNYDEEMLAISDRYIHPDDLDEFRTYMSLAHIKTCLDSGLNQYIFFCRRKLGGVYRFVKYLILPEQTDGQQPVESFYFYLEDVHDEAVKLIDYQGAKTYSRYLASEESPAFVSYYQNMLTILYDLTEAYIDYYMVDLERDLYIRYKVKSGTMKKAIPLIGSYSQSSISYIQEYCTGEQAEKLRQFCTSDKLRELMRDRMVLEYEFYSNEGRKLKTICVKSESVGGVPTKLICRTVFSDDDAVLKIKTFGNFEVRNQQGEPIHLSGKRSKELLAYLVDRQGYLVSNKDIVMDILEKSAADANAIKYCSTLIGRTIRDLEKAGFPNVIVKEAKSVRINMNAVDCDLYHLLNGDTSYLLDYHNEYMKEYSWAERTNADLQSLTDR